MQLLRIGLIFLEITTDAVMENRPNNENYEENTKDDGSNELITLVTLTSTTMTIQRGTLAMSMTTKTMTTTMTMTKKKQ